MTPRIPLSIDQVAQGEKTNFHSRTDEGYSSDAADDSQTRPEEAMNDASGTEADAPNQPNLQEILDALDDPDCRTIIQLLERPHAAAELDEMTEIPRSTLYRKLNLLSDAGLIGEDLEIRRDGQHRTSFQLAFEEVRIVLDENRQFDVALGRRDATPDERLSELWTEVGKET